MVVTIEFNVNKKFLQKHEKQISYEARKLNKFDLKSQNCFSSCYNITSSQHHKQHYGKFNYMCHWD